MTNLESGSWIRLDLRTTLKKILDYNKIQDPLKWKVGSCPHKVKYLYIQKSRLYATSKFHMLWHACLTCMSMRACRISLYTEPRKPEQLQAFQAGFLWEQSFILKQISLPSHQASKRVKDFLGLDQKNIWIPTVNSAIFVNTPPAPNIAFSKWRGKNRIKIKNITIRDVKSLRILN